MAQLEVWKTSRRYKRYLNLVYIPRPGPDETGKTDIDKALSGNPIGYAKANDG